VELKGKQTMVDIYVVDSTVYTQIDLTFDAMWMIMNDTTFNDDRFIEFTFSDGARAAIRKRCISGFTESMESIDS